MVESDKVLRKWVTQFACKSAVLHVLDAVEAVETIFYFLRVQNNYNSEQLQNEIEKVVSHVVVFIVLPYHVHYITHKVKNCES